MLVLLLTGCSACDGPDAGLPARETAGETAAGPDTPGPTETGESGPVDSAPPDTGPLALGDACDPAASRCDAGALCCTACCLPDAAPVCTEPDAYGACPLPDVVIDEEDLAGSLTLETLEVAADGCALVEGCVGAAGSRRVLRFTTTTRNVGTADVVLGAPGDFPDRFAFSSCHQHHHFLGYAEYRLLDGGGATVLTGHKQAFCLQDSTPPEGSTELPSYTCANQGMSVGWSDSYGYNLDCQWLDVTGLSAGEYTLEVEVNPERVFPERDHENSIVRIAVRLD